MNMYKVQKVHFPGAFDA